MATKASTLTELIAEWRAIAETWQAQLDDTPKGYVGTTPLKDTGRASIQNWINWLRNMAADAERLSGLK